MEDYSSTTDRELESELHAIKGKLLNTEKDSAEFHSLMAELNAICDERERRTLPTQGLARAAQSLTASIDKLVEALSAEPALRIDYKKLLAIVKDKSCS